MRVKSETPKCHLSLVTRVTLVIGIIQQTDNQAVAKLEFESCNKIGQKSRRNKVKAMLSQSKRPPFGDQNLSFCKAKPMLLQKKRTEPDKNDLLRSANVLNSQNVH